MKTSNKLLIAALVLALFSLAAYNIALRGEYKTEKFRDPYRDYIALDFTDFNEVDLHAADKMRVSIEPGDKHEVYLYNKNEKLVQLRQQGDRLHVDLVLPDEDSRLWYSSGPTLIIKVPHLALLRTDATHTFKGEQITTSKLPLTNNYYAAYVRGFQQDSMTLQIDNGSMVQLNGNTLQSLRATTGISPASEAKLMLMEDNQIQQAYFDVRHSSNLSIINAAIPDLRYDLSEDARLELQGKSLATLRK